VTSNPRLRVGLTRSLFSADGSPAFDFGLDVLQARSDVTSEGEGSPFVERPDFRPITKFEQRGARLGHGVWDLLYRKR